LVSAIWFKLFHSQWKIRNYLVLIATAGMRASLVWGSQVWSYVLNSKLETSLAYDSHCSLSPFTKSVDGWV